MTELTARECGGVTVIEVDGRLDALAAPLLDEALRQAMAEARVRLLLDFGRVTYISSSCLRVLILSARQSRERGGDLKLCCLSDHVRRIFALAGFDLVFELWESLDQALEAFVWPGGATEPCAGD